MKSYKSPNNETGIEDDELLNRAQTFYRASRDHRADWVADAMEDYDFVAGRQWSAEDEQYLRDQLRPVVTFNRIQPTIEAVTGTEVNNRQEVRYIPRTLGDAGVNEVLTEAARWVKDECDAEDEESDAFFDVVVSGMGWTDTCLDYEGYEDAPIRINRIDPLEMYWSPLASKRNISDAVEIGRKRKVMREWAVEKWPELDDMVPETTGTWGDTDDLDNEPHVDDPRLAYKKGAEQPQDAGQSKVVLFEYLWCKKEPAYKIADLTTGEIITADATQYRKLRKAAEAAGIQIRAVRTSVKKYYEAVFFEDFLLEAREASSQEGFRYKCITGKRDRNKNLWYGLVRTMKDPQKWANKFFSTVLHNINTSGQGIMAEVGAFENPKKASEEWSRPDKVTLLKNGAISGGKVMPKPTSNVPAMLPNMMEFAISSIRDVSGVSTELLGMAERQQPGVLEYQRKQAGINILANLFNSLRRYRKEQGRIMLDLIQKYIPDGTLIRVVGDEGAKYVPLVKQPGVAKYDVIVDDAPTSPNMKEKVWSILTPLMPVLLPMLPTSSKLELFKYSPLPESLVEKVAQQVTEMESQPRPDPMQAAIQADSQAKMAQIQARMQADMAKLEQQGQVNREKAQIDAEIEAFKALLKAETDRYIAGVEARFNAAQAQMDANIQQQQQTLQAFLNRFSTPTVQ